MDLFEKIIDEFNAKSLPYCLIRNFTKHEIKQSADIDFLIRRQDYKKFESILMKQGFVQIFSGPFPGHSVFIRDNPAEGNFINIDLHVDGIARDGMLYLPITGLIERREKYRNYYALSKEDRIIALALHSIIDKGIFKESYMKDIASNIKSKSFNKVYLMHRIREIHPLIGKTLYISLINLDFDTLLKMRYMIIAERLILYPKGLINMLSINSKRILKVFNPFWNGALVVFIGPEGGGKSYNSKLLNTNLIRSAIRCKRVYMGWHELILPFNKLLKTADRKVFANYQKKQTNSAIGKVRSMIIFAIYLIELYARYLIRILPARKIGIIITTDRYFYDGLILYSDVPFIFRRMLLKLIPKPTVCFYLKANIDNMTKRKPEVPYDTLKEQVRLHDYYSTHISCVKVTTDDLSSKTIARKINRILIERLSNKN